MTKNDEYGKNLKPLLLKLLTLSSVNNISINVYA